MRNILLFIILLVAANSVAQELNCRVLINMDQIQSADKASLKADMEKSFAAFMNSRKWTNDLFKA